MFRPDQNRGTGNLQGNQPGAIGAGEGGDLSIDGPTAATPRGTAFSLLPVENATGNYVKIVQRVPVKIVMDDRPTDVALGPGMSVVPEVRTDPTPSLYERLAAWL